MRIFIAVVVALLASIAPPSSALEPQTLVSEISAAAAAMSDYQTRVVSWATLDGVEERRIVDLYYKAPGRVRVDIREGSRFGDAGTVAILDRSGNVTAKPGIKLFPIALTYEKLHPRVTTLRGRAVDGALITSILEDMREELALGIVTIFLEDETYVFEASYYRDRTVVVERMYFDPQLLLPVRFETLEDGKRVEYAEWFHHLVDAGLPDEMFDVRYGLRDISRLPVRTLAAVPIDEDERSVFDRFD